MAERDVSPRRPKQATSSHVIIIFQATREPTSRGWWEGDSMADAIDEICRLFEQELIVTHPNEKHIEYDLNEVLNFMDQFHDLAILSLNTVFNVYEPRDRRWFKEALTKELTARA